MFAIFVVLSISWRRRLRTIRLLLFFVWVIISSLSVENVNPELASFLKDWLSEESSRLLPQIKLRSPYLHIDGKPITRDISKRIIAEWLKEQHTHL